MGKTVPLAGAETGEDLMPEFTLEELLDELYNEYYVPSLGPGEFNVTTFRKRKDMTDQAARRVIELALADGRIVEVGLRQYGRHRAMAYRMKDADQR